ncbi:hypothetical protein [Elizabethkingia anophelis]|uniref:hypothetical protein n=2 Tax=Elizabethkingia anophelis TaxID=1117645 RepID=UPI003732D714
MKKYVLLTIISMSTFTLNSCGVIFGGSKYYGTINVKDHPNADIYVDGNKIGSGQASKLFPRNAPLAVEIKQDNCEPKNQIFPRTFRTGNFILSVLSFGIIGGGVDLGTGAAYKPDHKDGTNVKKVSTKDFVFDIDYSQCKNL